MVEKKPFPIKVTLLKKKYLQGEKNIISEGGEYDFQCNI